MQEKKARKHRTASPKVYQSRCFPIKLQLPITIAFVRLIEKNNNKNKIEEIFKETKVYKKRQRKNFNLT